MSESMTENVVTGTARMRNGKENSDKVELFLTDASQYLLLIIIMSHIESDMNQSETE